RAGVAKNLPHERSALDSWHRPGWASRFTVGAYPVIYRTATHTLHLFQQRHLRIALLRLLLDPLGVLANLLAQHFDARPVR
ncbi:MAG TPA: hypothetical protein VK466_17165, partial [Terriglobales bacterium]|nr:hypothetical protein [Terriglobales bacterium]